MIDRGTNITDIETLEKISKVCKIGLKTTNSKIYTFGSNNQLKLKGKFNATIKNSGFEVYTWFCMIDKIKTENLLSKNTAEKLKILQIKGENIDAINSKNLGNVDIIIKEHKDLFEGILKLKDFELTLHIDKSVPPVVQTCIKIPYNLRQ